MRWAACSRWAGRSRCLGIFNLGRRTTEEEFRRIFERYGRLEKCNLVYDQKRDQSRGFGFVTYEHVDDAADAKKDASGLDIHGHQLVKKKHLKSFETIL